MKKTPFLPEYELSSKDRYHTLLSEPYHLATANFRVVGAAIEIISNICSYVTNEVDTLLFENYRIICGSIVGHELLKFVIGLYAGKCDDVIVEFQRRKGSTAHFYAIFSGTKDYLNNAGADKALVSLSSDKFIWMKDVTRYTFIDGHLIKVLSSKIASKDYRVQTEAIISLAKVSDSGVDVLSSDDLKQSLSELLENLPEATASIVILSMIDLIISLVSLFTVLQLSCKIDDQHEEWLVKSYDILVKFILNCMDMITFEKDVIMKTLVRRGGKLAIYAILQNWKE